MSSLAAILAERFQAARSFAVQAGDETLKYFRKNNLAVERKGDGSPVTIADRAAETLLRERIAEQFPEDAILGEEFGETDGTSGYRWILDPIDGTKSFIYGVPLYTTLVAVLQESAPPQTSDGELGEPLLGVIHSPATGETVSAARGTGCWYQQGDAEPEKTEVSTLPALSEGLFLTTESTGFVDRDAGDATDVYVNLQHAARITRTWGDAYGYLMVATGRAEAMIDPKLSLWDAAALQPIIEEAGGRFSDWQGTATVHSGDAIATNGQVHEEILTQTRGR